VTHYDVLGVPTDASTAAIRRAYVVLARRYHPDFHTNAAPEVLDANQRAMQAVNQAWTVLSDPESRRRYDQRFVRDPGRHAERDERRRTRDEEDDAARRAWRPFDEGDDEIDPRLLDDEPVHVTVSPRRQFVTVLPTVSFLAGVGTVLFGLVVNLLPLAALGIVLIVLAALGFLVLPLIELSASARNDRR
jgi:hypothetical protein